MDTAVELRVRLLEALAYGPTAPRPGPSCSRRADALFKGLQSALDASHSDAVKRFVDSFEANQVLLKPPLPISAASQAASLPPSVKAALVLEAEPDIRSIERDLRELDVQDKRGTAGAGSLGVAEKLLPELRSVQSELPQIAATYSDLEDQLAMLLVRYNDYVNSVSSMFVEWNRTVTDAEEVVTRLEKERSSL